MPIVRPDGPEVGVRDDHELGLGHVPGGVAADPDRVAGRDHARARGLEEQLRPFRVVDEGVDVGRRDRLRLALVARALVGHPGGPDRLRVDGREERGVVRDRVRQGRGRDALPERPAAGSQQAVDRRRRVEQRRRPRLRRPGSEAHRPVGQPQPEQGSGGHAVQHRVARGRRRAHRTFTARAAGPRRSARADQQLERRRRDDPPVAHRHPRVPGGDQAELARLAAALERRGCLRVARDAREGSAARAGHRDPTQATARDRRSRPARTLATVISSSVNSRNSRSSSLRGSRTPASHARPKPRPMSAGAPVASISWTTRPSSWISPRVSMAAHPNIASGPMLARSANGTAASRARSADRTGTAVGSTGGSTAGESLAAAVDHLEQLPRLVGMLEAEPDPDPEPVDVRRRAGRGTILVGEPGERIVDGGVQRRRVAEEDRRHRSASRRGYGLHAPRPAMSTHAPASAGRETYGARSPAGATRTGHPVAQEQVVARSHDRGQARPRGRVDREGEAFDERESRHARASCPRSAGRSSGTARRRGRHPPGRRAAWGRPRRRRGRGRERPAPRGSRPPRRVRDRRRRRPRPTAGSSMRRSHAAPASVVSSTTGTSAARRPGCSGSMSSAGADDDRRRLRAPQPELLRARPQTPARMPDGHARASTRGDGRTGRCRRRRGRRRRSRGAGP